MDQGLWLITLMLADGRALTYSGPHELGADDRVVGSCHVARRDLPPGCSFETLYKEPSDAGDD